MKILAAELTGQIAVGVAWLLLVALPTHADPATGDARSAAPAARAAPAAAPSVLLLPPRLPPPPATRPAPRPTPLATAWHRTSRPPAWRRSSTARKSIASFRSGVSMPGRSRPMLSYDAMIRLEADTSRLAPETTLSLIDLSTGNVIAQQTFAWPPKEDDAKAMLDFCRDALKKVAKPAAGKLRVRTLWVDGGHRQRADEALGRTADRGLRRVAAAVRARRARPPPGGRHGQRGIAAVADGAEPVAGREAIHASGRRHDRAPRRRGRRPRQNISPRRRWRSACGSARGPATRAIG